MYPERRPATLFEHPWFRDSDQYPNGAADMAGYWAEARILGGVVHFDRRPNGEPDPVYLHPDREDATYRIFRLLPERKQNLVEFLTTEADSPTNPLPIMGDENNLNRVDPEKPMEETGIYRDVWERKFRPLQANDARPKDVWDRVEFPTINDWTNAALRARDCKFESEYGRKRE